MAQFDLDGNPLLDLANGDAQLSRQLRDSLQRLSKNSGDFDFKQMVDDVLNGRRSLREAARSELFTSELTVDTDRLDAGFDEVTQDERQNVVAPEEVERLSGLRAQVQEKMAEIEDQMRELQRLKQDLDESGHDPAS